MPKKFSAPEKRGWLDLYEKGNTELQIAGQFKCDVRTVRKGIEEARRETDARAARTEVFKNALQKHQNDLLRTIRRLPLALTIPPSSLKLRGERDANPPPIRLPEATANYDSRKGWTIALNDENTLLWELLKEHLGRDRMWDALARWKKALSAHLEARVALKRKAATLSEKKTGLKVDLTETTYVEPRVVDLFYQVALNRALGIPDGTNPEKNIRALGHGEVAFLDSLVARAVEGADEECAENLLEAFKELQESPEAESVRSTYTEVEESAAKAKRAVEEISLLQLVTGQCRVCRRLGI